MGALRCCDHGHTEINFIVSGMEKAAACSLAKTDRSQARNPNALTLDPPPGFAAGLPARRQPVFYAPTGRDGGEAWTTDLQLLEARSGGSPVDVTVGDRNGFRVQAPGGPRYQSLTLAYDQRTIVTLSDGLTPDELVAAAASLRPGDASTAPDVSGDPARCSRLGLCG